MSKRHYTRTDTGLRCVSCRQEFENRRTLVRHWGAKGTCKHPMTLRLSIDLSISPYHWTKAA